METVKEEIEAEAREAKGVNRVLQVIEGRKALLSKRLIAFVIDGIVATVLWQVPLVGKLLGLSYILFRDGLEIEFMKGRSIGKKLMGLKPVRLNKQPMDISASVRRNWVFVIAGVAGLFRGIPLFGVFIVLAAVALGIFVALYELYLVVSDTKGRRWGDFFAGTQIVESTD